MILIVLTSLSTAIFVVYLFKYISPPLPYISKRVSPYDSVSRVRINESLESNIVFKSDQKSINSALMDLINKHFFNLIVKKDDVDIKLLLIQAGLDISVESYKNHLVKKMLLGSACGLMLGMGLGNLAWVLFFTIVGGLISYSKTYSLLEKKIEKRKTIIKFELATINHLLAIYTRTGSGVTQSLKMLSNRTKGIVCNEINMVLARVNSGMPIDESLMTSIRNSPEPHFKRTFKLLASASNRGADLAQGLLDLSEDLRRDIREEVKISGAKRRAAMLLPTIGILAPIMLLFVAAPIPSIVLTGN